MVRSLFSKLVRRNPQARRGRSSRVSFQTEQLEVRTLLTADVLAQIVGGNLYLTGVDAGSRALTVTQDNINPTLLNITPGANTTINGSASVVQLPGTQITGGVSIYLNNGLGSDNTTTLSINAPSFALAGSAYVTLVGNGNDSVTVVGGTIHGSAYVAEIGSGTNSVNLNGLRVDGVASVYTGTGTSAINVTEADFGTTFLTAAGATSQISDTGSSQGSTFIYAGGTAQIGVDCVSFAGSLFVNAGNGNHNVFIESVQANQIGISLGSGTIHNVAIDDVSSLGMFVVTGSGDTAIGISYAEINGSLTIVTGVTGNDAVQISGGVSVSGPTTIVTGNGNDAIGIGGLLQGDGGDGPPGLAPISNATLRSLTIVMGNGHDSVLMTALQGTSLTLLTGTGTSNIAIGGTIDIPTSFPYPVNSAILGAQGSVVAGGPVNFSGPVLIQSLGSNNVTQIQQSNFGSAFTLYDLKGSNLLGIDDSTFNGTAAFYMGGSNNVINIERNNDLVGNTVFNKLAFFDYFNATSKGGGGAINIGFTAAVVPTARFNADAYFIGAHLTTWPGASFSKNPILILSDRVQLP